MLRQTTEVDPQAGGSEQVCGDCSSLHQRGGVGVGVWGWGVGGPPSAHPRHRRIRFTD